MPAADGCIILKTQREREGEGRRETLEKRWPKERWETREGEEDEEKGEIFKRGFKYEREREKDGHVGT